MEKNKHEIKITTKEPDRKVIKTDEKGSGNDDLPVVSIIYPRIRG
ncbi:MAG: hypothetical protein ACTSXQ_03975 [Alphaproteobacteria bacterium]